MNEPHSNPPGTLRWGAVLAGVAVLLAVAALLLRQKYPDGSFLHQQRTVLVENHNPDLAEVVLALVPGRTTTEELVAELGEPAAKVEQDDLELWVYVMRVVKETERRLLGLVRTGGGTSVVESQMPVGVRDGVVVHTYVNPSEDPAVKEAIQSLWDAYTSGP